MVPNRVRLKLTTLGAFELVFLITFVSILLSLCSANQLPFSDVQNKRDINDIKSEFDSGIDFLKASDKPHDEYNEYALIGDERTTPLNKSHRHGRNHKRSHHSHYHNSRHAFDNFKHEKKRTTVDSQNKANNDSDVAVNSVQRDYMAAVVGKDVQLDCKMKNIVNDDDKIVWLRMPKGEVLTLNSNRVTSDSRVSTRCISNSVPCWSLIISNTRESDTGFYVCQTNAMQTKYVYLDIMVPPKLLTQYPVDRIDVNQTTNASITCEFYGKPDPLVKWYKYNNGVQKEIEKFRGSKTISVYIHKDSASEYECVADNSIPPTVSKKIYLNIQYAPQIKFLNSKVFQKKGERVIFDCNVNSNPLSKIYWFKNQTRIYESHKFNFENLDDSYHRLYINNLTDGDFGDYFCTAVNLLGKSTSKIQLIELRPSSEHKKPSPKPATFSSSIDVVTNQPETTHFSTPTSSWYDNAVEINTSTAESSQNETVIRISLNRDKVDYYDPLVEEISSDRKPEIGMSPMKTKSILSKLPSYRSDKHHLHNRTKILKNHRKQIQKAYMNGAKKHQLASSTNSIYMENNGLASAIFKCRLHFLNFFLLPTIFIYLRE